MGNHRNLRPPSKSCELNVRLNAYMNAMLELGSGGISINPMTAERGQIFGMFYWTVREQRPQTASPLPVQQQRTGNPKLVLPAVAQSPMPTF